MQIDAELKYVYYKGYDIEVTLTGMWKVSGKYGLRDYFPSLVMAKASVDRLEGNREAR